MINKNYPNYETLFYTIGVLSLLIHYAFRSFPFEMLAGLTFGYIFTRYHQWSNRTFYIFSVILLIASTIIDMPVMGYTLSVSFLVNLAVILCLIIGGETGKEYRLKRIRKNLIKFYQGERLEAIKYILVYIHRYAGLWCIAMGYWTLFCLICFNDGFTIPIFSAVGLFLMILIIGVSLFASENLEKGIYRSFGVWW